MMLFMFFLVFAFQNKVPGIHERSEFADKLLKCCFCMGTHSGWITWFLATGMNGTWLLPTWWQNVISLVIWAGIGAAFSYSLDIVLRLIEGLTGLWRDNVDPSKED
jgi:hypothetical protein